MSIVDLGLLGVVVDKQNSEISSRRPQQTGECNHHRKDKHIRAHYELVVTTTTRVDRFIL